MSWRLIFFTVVFVVLLLYLIISRILIIRAVKYTIANNIYQGPGPIELTLPDVPLSFQPGHFDFDIARTCIFLTNSVYDEDQSTAPLPDKVQQTAQFRLKSNNNSVYGAVYTYQDILWVAFRGSSSIYDVLRDVKTNQLPPTWPLNRTDSTTSTTSLDDGSDTTPMIHEGFHSMYGELRDQIIDWIATVNADSKIILTGHSLGAGLAILTASDKMFSKFSYNQVLVYTFASPRLGNPSFIKFLGDSQLRCYRVANSDDIIATTPLSITIRPFHPHNPYLYEHFGVPIIFNLNRYCFLANHSLFWYYDAMSRPFSFQLYGANYVKDKKHNINEYCGFYDNFA